MVSPSPVSVTLLTFISNEVSICLIISRGISCPIILLIFSKLSNTCTSSIFIGYSSQRSLEISPPAISVMSIAACFSAYLVIFGSTPRSNLNEASVLNPCLFAVFLILIGSKYADSRKILVVCSLIPEFNPPKTPAIHIGFLVSQIIRSSSLRVRSIPSSVINFSFFCAVRTISFLPLILSASKA